MLGSDSKNKPIRLVKNEEHLKQEKELAEYLAQQPPMTEEEMLALLEVVTE